MTGEVVVSRPVSRAAAVVWFALAALCCLGVFVGVWGWGLFALLPFALGLAALLSADPPVEFQVCDDGLQFEQPHDEFVKYDDLRGLTRRAGRGWAGFPIEVYHTDGMVRIPAELNVRSKDLYEFLLARLPWLGTPDGGPVPPRLYYFVNEQVGLFGTEKVFVFRARPFPPVVQRHHLAYSAAVAAVGAVWLAAGVVMQAFAGSGVAWLVMGIVSALLGGVFAFLFAREGRAKDWQNACLVVSPAGVALVQGALRGTMRWNELEEIHYPARKQFGLALGNRAGLGLQVAGAYLIVADYFDRPLPQIKDCLREYWGGRGAN